MFGLISSRLGGSYARYPNLTDHLDTAAYARSHIHKSHLLNSIMGKHLFIHKMQHGDMLISKLSYKAQLIEYQVVSKEGNPMEPIKKDKLIIHKGEIIFDKNRALPVDYAKHIENILTSE